jgi:hypothetical protein
MTSTIERGGWLVYIDGVECPAISANISSGVWTIPTANVSFPADRSLQRIGVNDRTRMTIFALDTFYARSQGRKPEFVRVFDGEIVDYSYSSSGGGRSISFTAVDFMESLSRVFPYIVQQLTDIIESQTTTQGGVTVANNPFAPSHAMLTTGFKTGGRVRRPFDFVTNILEYLGGDTLPDSAQSEVIRQWFKPWLDRTGFKSMFVPSSIVEEVNQFLEVDTVFPILKATQSKEAIKAVAGQGDQTPGGSFYAIIEAVFQAMYYEILMLPSAPLLKVNKTTRNVYVENLGEIGPQVETENVVASYITKPQTLFGIPPRFNVFWPSMYENFNYSENYATQPTRTYLGDPHMLNTLRAKPDLVVSRLLTVGYPAIANERLNVKRTNHNDEASVFSFVTEEERYKGPVFNNMNTPSWFLYLQQETSTKNPNSSLQARFCRYEHLRTRASRRNAGLSGPYNPYAIAGFPGTVIDNEESSTHITGYVTNVSHSFSQDSMSTQVGMSHASTISEFFDTLTTELNDDGVGDTIDTQTVTSAPQHPIEDIRNAFQTLGQASKYFDRMFYGVNDGSLNSVFDMTRAFGVVGSDETVKGIDLRAGNRDHVRSNATTGEPPDFRVIGENRNLLTDPDAAMQYVSRPICTLEQFIDSMGARGVRQDLRLTNDPIEGKGAPYYVRIFLPQTGEATQSGVDMDGNPCDVSGSDSSRSWYQRLLAYRNRIYHAAGPFRG